jgi:hypothetical protein|tara:strand:- start:812 stop:1198 length:387 start_codon:yes stop_codon:yes gene_type:complete
MTFRISSRGASASKDGERYRKGIDAVDTNASSWRLVLREDGKHFMEAWVDAQTPSGRSRTTYVTIRLSDEEVADMGEAIKGFNIHHHALGEYELRGVIKSSLFKTHLYANEEITGSHQTKEDLKINKD